jgi:hypothetical protein
MKREILFKAKKHSNEWVEGNLILSENKAYIVAKTKEPILEDRNNWWVINAPSFQVIPETVSQLINQKDKKGKNVFEGDYDSDGNVILWCKDCNGFEFAAMDTETKEIFINCHRCDGNFFFDDQIRDFEVIGNIAD